MRCGQIQLRGRLRWIIKRYQVRRQFDRQAVANLPIVFGNAIPKSGSKLLFNILRGFTKIGPFVDSGLNEIKPFFLGEPTSQNWILGQLEMLKPGDIRFGYLYATDENISAVCLPGWAVFLIIRDPRDQIVSEVFYAVGIHEEHKLHDYLVSLKSIEDRIAALINGIQDGGVKRINVREHYELFLPWLTRPEVYVMRFEDIVNDPAKEIDNVLNYMEEKGFFPRVSRAEAVEILRGQMSPEKSETFREGKTGQWRDYYTAENIIQFEEVAGDLLDRLGYEK